MSAEMHKELVEKYRLVTHVYRAMTEELGQEKALEIMSKAWIQYGKGNMARRAEELGDNSLRALGAYYNNSRSTEVDRLVVEASEDKVALRITRCGHYDAFKELGAPEVCLKYCESDYEACKAFNPAIIMLRDKVLAEGDDHCNHTWVMEK
jgi:hypothetical protein